LTSRQLRLGSLRPEDWDAHEWIPRGWEWVDPLKEILAIEKACALLIDSRTRAAAERGRDYEEVVADRARELELLEAAGLEDATADDDLATRLVTEQALAEGDGGVLVAALSNRVAPYQPDETYGGNGNGPY